MRRLVVIALLVETASAAPVLSHSGRLLDSAGVPLNGSFEVGVQLVDAQGEVALTESHPVQLRDGYYAVVLGTQDTLDASDLLRPHDVVLSIDNQELARTALSAVPLATAVEGAVRVVDSPACGVDTQGALAVAGGQLQVCDGSTYSAVAPPATRAHWRGQAATTTARARIATGQGGAGSGQVPWNEVETAGADIISLDGTDIIRFSQAGYIDVDYTQDIICDSTNYGILEIQRYPAGVSTPQTLKRVLSEVHPDEWASLHGHFTLPVQAGAGIGFGVRCSGGSITAIDATDWSLLTILWEPL